MPSSLKEISEDYILGLKILQKKDGHRLTVDPILLFSFVLSHLKESDSILDMGTGFGIIPLLISQRKEGAKIIGVEIQKDLVRLAEENLKLNGVHENITIIEGDFRNLKNRFKEGEFDWVLSNPPYMEPSAGRISPCEERAFARHEFHGDMKQLVTASAYFVSNTGRVSFIYPIRRFVQLLFCLKTAGLNPQRVRFVHPFEDSAAELFIIEARKGGKDSLKVEKPIILGETNLDEIIADNV